MINEFKEYLIINGYSKSTITDYLYRVNILLKENKIEDLNEENIRNFFFKLKDKYNPITINLFRSAIKLFLEFLDKNIRLPKSIKIEDKLPDSIEEKFFRKKIIPTVEKYCDKPLKNKAILYFMFYTGIRVSEFEFIYRKNIDFEKRRVKIYIPKTKEERIIPFTKEVAIILKSFFITEPEDKNAFNITKSGVQRLCDRLKKYFPDIKLRPHLFRHSYATMMLERGLDVSKVSKLLGHKNINTTLKYLRLDIDTLQKGYDKAFE